jgi:DNA-binding MarR family transcriptional regulator
MLAMLAANGPTYVREIARQRGVDASATFRAASRLIKSGIAVKRDEPGGRKYLAVNRAHYASRRLWPLLMKLSDEYEIPGDRNITYRWKLPLERDPHPEVDERWMFGHPTRSRTLTIVAVAKEIDIRRISQVLAIDDLAVGYTVRALERDGIIRSKREGKRRVVSLEPSCPIAKELQHFILRLVDDRSQYKGLANAARFKMSLVSSGNKVR